MTYSSFGRRLGDLTWNNWSSLMFPKIEERRVKWSDDSR